MTLDEYLSIVPWGQHWEENFEKAFICNDPTKCSPVIAAKFTGEMRRVSNALEAFQIYRDEREEWDFRGALRDADGDYKVYFWKKQK